MHHLKSPCLRMCSMRATPRTSGTGVVHCVGTGVVHCADSRSVAMLLSMAGPDVRHQLLLKRAASSPALASATVISESTMPHHPPSLSPQQGWLSTCSYIVI